jgi:hypothetical protein
LSWFAKGFALFVRVDLLLSSDLDFMA